jgi:2,4-dienoyl-CoA reductase-like NADH-dependent reductase (Old Yellow Enzyme family)
MTKLFEPMAFVHGPAMKNRFMLAPLTNCQSHDDGTLSDGEFRWLTMRAEGGFGLTVTCASHVQAQGRGFPGQLGIFSDDHLPGLARLAAAIRRTGSLAMVQLHHAGVRSPSALIGGQPVGPSDDEATGARALGLAEVERLVGDFVAAALRAERAGFDGVELHGAHGYVLAQFLSPDTNRRDDRYGGSLENRSRILFEILSGIRSRCGAGFNVGVRISPERFGLRLPEMVNVAGRLMTGGMIDFLDLSLWDVFKEPLDAEYQGRSLLSYFAGLDRGRVRLGAAGRISSGADAVRALEAGLDFVIVGRAAILHHDFPELVRADPGFTAATLPVTAEYLVKEGLGPAFVAYMGNWKGFVAPAPEAAAPGVG